ncbi:hypothetical protein J6590_051899 [Homalodisca vitripennis]|nr:hypothetical protein J6590_051899 [Homalodisca vitripennis]
MTRWWCGEGAKVERVRKSQESLSEQHVMTGWWCGEGAKVERVIDSSISQEALAVIDLPPRSSGSQLFASSALAVSIPLQLPLTLQRDMVQMCGLIRNSQESLSEQHVVTGWWCGEEAKVEPVRNSQESLSEQHVMTGWWCGEEAKVEPVIDSSISQEALAVIDLPPRSSGSQLFASSALALSTPLQPPLTLSV